MHSFYCLRCGSYKRVIREVWSQNSEGPDSIQLIQHKKMKPKIVDVIKLRREPRRPAYYLTICGKCGAPVTTVCRAGSINKPWELDL